MTDDNQQQDDIQITAPGATGQGGSTQQQQTQGTGGPAGQQADTSLIEEAEAAAGPDKKDKYNVPEVVKEKFPDLKDLILTTESMNDEERDYWFQILPIMTEEQIGKFREILLNEKQQLTKLDQEYEEQLNKLNEKHMIEWKEFESKEKRKELKRAERKTEEEERVAEEELLARLAEI